MELGRLEWSEVKDIWKFLCIYIDNFVVYFYVLLFYWKTGFIKNKGIADSY